MFTRSSKNLVNLRKSNGEICRMSCSGRISISQFSTPRSIWSDLVAGSAVASVLSGQCGKWMVIDVRISSGSRMVRMSRLDGLERGHSSTATVVMVMRHSSVRMMMQTSGIGRWRMSERIVHIHAVVMSWRRIEDAARTGCSALLARIRWMIVEIVATAVDIGRCVASGCRERPGVAWSRSVDGRRSGAVGRWGSHTCLSGSHRFVAQFALSGETLQVRHESKPHRILDIHPFDGDQVTRHFSSAFAESNIVIIHGEFVRIVCQWIQTCSSNVSMISAFGHLILAWLYFHGQRENKISRIVLNYFNDWMTIWPFAWSIFRWSTVSWRISAFSNFADPCFSKADGTRRLNSDKLWLMRSRRRFSMIPRLLFRVMLPPVVDAPHDSLSPSPGEEQLKKTK